MKNKNIVLVLLVAVILVSCAPTTNVAPTETPDPTSTWRFVAPPTFPIPKNVLWGILPFIGIILFIIARYSAEDYFKKANPASDFYTSNLLNILTTFFIIYGGAMIIYYVLFYPLLINEIPITTSHLLSGIDVSIGFLLVFFVFVLCTVSTGRIAEIIIPTLETRLRSNVGQTIVFVIGIVWLTSAFFINCKTAEWLYGSDIGCFPYGFINNKLLSISLYNPISSPVRITVFWTKLIDFLSTVGIEVIIAKIVSFVIFIGSFAEGIKWTLKGLKLFFGKKKNNQAA